MNGCAASLRNLGRALAALATAASAQQRIYYDASGKSLGGWTSDSVATVTNTENRAAR